MTSLDKKIIDSQAYLHPMALKLTHDSEEAKELLQETMVKAIRYKNKFKEGTNLKGWMYTIMRNTFITKYHRVINRYTAVDPNEEAYKWDQMGLTVENDALGSLILKDVQLAIHEIEEKFSKPFEMYFQGYKYKEIAEALHIPIGTVKNRIHQARAQLKSKLSSYAN